MVFRPYIVTVAWLVQSAKQGSPADEELFKFDPGETLCNDTFQAPAAPAPRIRQSSHVDRVSVTAFETHISNGNRDSRYSAVVNDSVASSKVTINESGTSRRTSSSSTSSSSSESDTSRGSKSRTRGTSKGTSEVSDKTYDGAGTNAGDTNTSMDVDPEGLLVGLTFQVALDDPNEKELIEGHIKSNAGRLVKSGAEIVILPTICDAVAKDMADISHTKYWLVSWELKDLTYAHKVSHSLNISTVKCANRFSFVLVGVLATKCVGCGTHVLPQSTTRFQWNEQINERGGYRNKPVQRH